MKDGQLAVLSIRNIGVVGLVCRNLLKGAAKNHNCKEKGVMRQ